MRSSRPYSSMDTRPQLRSVAGPPECEAFGGEHWLNMYYVYALYSNIQDKFYVGFTEDLKRRIKEHAANKSISDRRMKNLELVYYEAYKSKIDAQAREKQLKTGFGRQYLRKRLQDSIRMSL